MADSISHDWNVTAQQAVRLQLALRERVVPRLPGPLPTEPLVAGADISYDKGSDRLYAAVCVLRIGRGNHEPILEEIQRAVGRAVFPYVPGLLSFREAPMLLKAFARLKTCPHALLVDGQGVAHPRRFGVACHLGLWLDLPTIGCAKSRLIGEYKEPGADRGHCAVLRHQREIIGRVVRTKAGVKPLFVSIGHKIDLDSAQALVLACCTRYRLPEPTRQAHIEVNRMRTANPASTP